MINFLVFTIAIILLPFSIYSQDDTLQKKTDSSQIDIRYYLVKKGWIKKITYNDKFLFLIPVIGANPANGFIYGGGLAYIYKSKGSVRFSTISTNASYSTKNLGNFNIRSNLFKMKDKLFLNGDWGYFIIKEKTYGLGGNPNSPAQSLGYDHLRFHEIALWEFFTNFFAGVGIHYDHYFNSVGDTLVTGSSNASYDYLYSTEHGFDLKGNTISGLSLNLLFDNRDNPVNSYKGCYANVNFRVNGTAYGSSKNSTMLLADYRSFYSLDAENRHILAFWLYGNFVVNGDVPYLSLPALGYDQRQRTGRGYAFGYLRGEDLLYAESEYRFSISPKTNILGGVIFANFTSVSNRENNIALLKNIWGAGGAGLRIMIDKQSRTRLDFDAAFGNKIGLYVAVRETF
jgi:outer membrane protein assembly factor BamA